MFLEISIEGKSRIETGIDEREIDFFAGHSHIYIRREQRKMCTAEDDTLDIGRELIAVRIDEVSDLIRIIIRFEEIDDAVCCDVFYRECVVRVISM
jgi:hypothetical protein